MNRKAALFTIALSVATFFLRLPTVENRSLGANESTTLLTVAGQGQPKYPEKIESPRDAARELFNNVTSYKDIIHELETSDGHPPTYYWLLLSWDHVFGPGLTQSRLLSTLFGSVFILLIGSITISELALPEYILFQLLIAFSSTLAYFATEARSYMFCLVLELAAVVYSFYTLRTKPEKLTFNVFTVGVLTGLAVFTNYLMVLMAFSVGLWILYETRRLSLKKIMKNAAAFAIPNILFCFWARHFYEVQHDVHASNRNGFKGFTSDVEIYSRHFVRTFINRVDIGTTVLVAAFLIATLLVVLLKQKRPSQKSLLTIGSLFVLSIVGALFIIDFAMVKYMYPFRYFILAAPGIFIVVAIALAVEKAPRLRWGFNSLVALVLAVELYNFNWTGTEIGRTDYSKSPVRDPVSEVLAGRSKNEKILLVIEHTSERDWPTGIIGDLARRADQDVVNVDVYVLPTDLPALTFFSDPTLPNRYKQIWYMANEASSVPARETFQTHPPANYVVTSRAEWGFGLRAKPESGN